MTTLSFIGNALIAFGPAVVVFLAYFARRPSLGLLVLASSFFGLVALLITSSIWLLLPGRAEMRSLDPTKSSSSAAATGATLTLVVSVVVQELVRFGSWHLIRIAEGGIILASENPRSKLHRVGVAGACGYGFGLVVALVTHVQALAESAGPGVRPSATCPAMPAVFLGSIQVMLGFFHQLAWTMLLFHALFQGVPVPGSSSHAGARVAASPPNSNGGVSNASSSSVSSASPALQPVLGAPVPTAGGPVVLRRPVLVAYVVVSHFVVSLTSLLQSPSVAASCAAPPAISAAILAVSAGLVWTSVRATVKKVE
ncbi:hypothetical protein H9P43_000361 [Blastocladiella emersonii ATCC 22665]|nr:hypothetical protein H9P43_000361 [Blastocladiella emersonii ATCC 22665]